MTMLFDTPWHPGGFTFGVAGLGTRGDAVAQAGTHGKGILADDVELPAEAADEFIYRITTMPPLLTLLRWFDDGGVEAEGPPGVHTGVAERRRNGVVYGSAAFTVVIGGGVLSGGITLDSAAPSGTLGQAGPSQLSGGITLDSAAPGGSISVEPPAQLGGGVTTDDAIAGGVLAGAPAPAPFMPRRSVTLLYSVLDPSALPDLTSKDPTEDLHLVADFAPFTSVSAPVWELLRVGGDDGTEPLVTVGGSSIVGGRVTQRVAGGASGNTYTVRCTAQGPEARTLVAFARLPVRTRA